MNENRSLKVRFYGIPIEIEYQTTNEPEIDEIIKDLLKEAHE